MTQSENPSAPVQDVTLVRLTILANQRLLPGVCALVRETAQQSGLDKSQILHLELLAEELCLVVIEHAFAGRSSETFDIEITWRPGEFIFAVEDKGSPFDIDDAEKSSLTDLGVKLLKGLCSDIKVENLGRKGMRVEITKSLQIATFEQTLLDDVVDSLGDDRDNPSVAAHVELELRRMCVDDAKSLATLMYNVYGYSYKDLVYFPEKIRDKVINEQIFSYVAVTPEGEVVAHQGLLRGNARERIAETAMSVVDPRFRGRRLFETLKSMAYTEIVKRGVYGIWCVAVTLHAYSQRANVTAGAKETGFLLNYINADRLYKGLEALKPVRRPTVWMYTRIADEPRRISFVPAWHHDIVARIYGHAGLARSLNISEETVSPVNEVSVIDVSAASDMAMMTLRVLEIGHDIELRVSGLIDMVRKLRFEVVYIDIPMNDKCITYACKALESVGFCFAAVTPETQNGDSLRLQFINSEMPPDETIVTVTEFGAQLLAYVLAGARAAGAVTQAAA